MPTPRRTPAQHAATLALFEQHKGDRTAAAKASGVPRNTFYGQLFAAREWDNAGRPMPPERESYHSGRRLPQTADECWAVLDDFIGRSRVTNAARKVVAKHRRSLEKLGDGKSRHKRIVVAGDFHAPFADPWAVGELIAREGGKADTLIVNGDIQDFYAISRFTKYEPVSVESELAAVDALLGQLAAAFPEVVLVGGNHDTQRFEKQLRSFLSPEMCHVIEFLTGGNLSVLRVIAKRYPNVRFADTKIGRFHAGWYLQHGDIITAHAEKYSRVPGAALRGIEEWFTDQEGTLGLKPWRVLIQAHTHQLGMFPWRADKLLVEGGSMCQTHGYQLQAKIMGRPQRTGYVTLEQTKGVTDINSVRLVWLDADRERAA
jgi:predicted phosphodiesterase